jgi:hypothetical protein
LVRGASDGSHPGCHESAGGTVVVASGGLTGIEFAAEIAEQHPDMQVVLASGQEPGAMSDDGDLGRGLGCTRVWPA